MWICGRQSGNGATSSLSPAVVFCHYKSANAAYHNCRNQQHCSITLLAKHLSALFVFISRALTLFMPGNEDKVSSLCPTLKAHSGHFNAHS